MTQLLNQAMTEVYKLPPEEQDIIAVTILDKLQDKPTIRWNNALKTVLGRLIHLLSTAQSGVSDFNTTTSAKPQKSKLDLTDKSFVSMMDGQEETKDSTTVGVNEIHRFPDLTEFRASIALKGEGMSETIIQQRREARY